jgi:hypothetical protein
MRMFDALSVSLNWNFFFLGMKAAHVETATPMLCDHVHVMVPIYDVLSVSKRIFQQKVSLKEHICVRDNFILLETKIIRGNNKNR